MDSRRQTSAFDRYLKEICGESAADLKPDDPFRVGMKIADTALDVFRRKHSKRKTTDGKPATNAAGK